MDRGAMRTVASIRDDWVTEQQVELADGRKEREDFRRVMGTQQHCHLTLKSRFEKDRSSYSAIRENAWTTGMHECSVASVMSDSLQPYGLLARQAPLPMGFSRQEHCSGLPCPPPGDLPNPGIEPMSPASSALQADSLPLSHRETPSYWRGAHHLTLEVACCLPLFITYYSFKTHIQSSLLTEWFNQWTTDQPVKKKLCCQRQFKLPALSHLKYPHYFTDISKFPPHVSELSRTHCLVCPVCMCTRRWGVTKCQFPTVTLLVHPLTLCFFLGFTCINEKHLIICLNCWNRKYIITTQSIRVSQMVLVVKNLPANARDIRDTGSIPRKIL